MTPTRFDRKDIPWLLSLLLAGALALGVFAWHAHTVTEGQGSVPLDDAWIHFQFARNLARGDGLSFNPGHPTSGSTAPLWSLLLAAAYFLGGRFPWAGILLSALCYAATLLATYLLAKQITRKRWRAWLAGMIVALNGRMVWAGLSALETCLFTALSLLAIAAHLQDRAAGRYRITTAALFGVAALSRPEGYLLFGLAMLDYVWYLLRHPDSNWIKNLRRLPWLPVLVFVLLVAPYLIFSWRTSGHLLPNTYHAKAVVTWLPDRDFLSLTARYLILDNPLLLPFLILGSLSMLKKAPLLSVWSAGLPLAYAFMHASLYQHGRYLMPLIPCNAILSMAGLWTASTLAQRRHWRWPGTQKQLVALVCLLAMLGTAWRLPVMANQYTRNVDDINHMHVALGRWVTENTPDQAVLALNDIGAITYISERPVIDLAGLVTPEMIPLLQSGDPQGEDILAFLEQQQVEYVIIFPNWFPMLAQRTDVLTPVHQVTLEQNSIAGGETMVVYQAEW